MGHNAMMLYTEDTYEVPGYPCFGQYRSRYTREELTALDDYADMLGIELITCIQTVSHLERVLRWLASWKSRRKWAFRPRRCTTGTI